MNIDTDLQWGFTTGTRDYFAEIQRICTISDWKSKGEDLPNKKYYDPRNMD